MSVIDLDVKRRILQADARVVQLEKLLSTWVAYCDQSGVSAEPFSAMNPLHTLLRDTRAALAK